MSKKDFNLRLEKILTCIDHINADILDIEFEDFEQDRRRQDAVLFNLTRISWALKKMDISFPRQMKKLPQKETQRLKRFGEIIDSYGNDPENAWFIITEQLPEYEKIFREAIEKS